MASVAQEIRNQATAPLRPVRLGKLDPVIEKRAEGVIYIRAAQALGPYHDKLSQPLEHWAENRAGPRIPRAARCTGRMAQAQLTRKCCPA